MKTGIVKAVSKSATHTMRKWNDKSIELVKGLGVKGDAHLGKTVKHRSRVARDPNQPNLRQVHLIQSELHSELHKKGFEIKPGDMGENITTEGIDLLNLPQKTILSIGPTSKILVTGLRNPCSQLNGVQPGLLKAVIDRDENGVAFPLSGVMGIVLEGGEIRTGDTIEIKYPEAPFLKLEKV